MGATRGGRGGAPSVCGKMCRSRTDRLGMLDPGSSRQQGREGKGWEGGGGYNKPLGRDQDEGFMLARFVDVCKSEWVM